METVLFLSSLPQLLTQFCDEVPVFPSGSDRECWLTLTIPSSQEYLLVAPSGILEVNPHDEICKLPVAVVSGLHLDSLTLFGPYSLKC